MIEQVCIDTHLPVLVYVVQPPDQATGEVVGSVISYAGVLLVACLGTPPDGWPVWGVRGYPAETDITSAGWPAGAREAVAQRWPIERSEEIEARWPTARTLALWLAEPKQASRASTPVAEPVLTIVPAPPPLIPVPHRKGWRVVTIIGACVGALLLLGATFSVGYALRRIATAPICEPPPVEQAAP